MSHARSRTTSLARNPQPYASVSIARAFRLVAIQHWRQLLRLLDVPDLGRQIVATQRDAEQEARQTKALKRLGCAVIYSDKASGKSMAGRPELARALDDLDTGDELVIAEWDRATRSMWDGLQIIKAVIDAGASIKVLDRSYIDLETPMGRGFMAMMSAMAEDEHLRIIKRTHEGRKLAQAKGVRMGRKPKLTPHQKTEARRRIAKGESTRDLAKSYGVSVSTIERLGL